MNSARVFCVGATSGVMPMVAVWLVSVSSVYAQCETQKLIADDGAGGDYLGKSVAVSGDTVLIGASKVDYVGNDMGAAYVFRRNGAAWEQAPRLVAADATLGDHGAHFGSPKGGVAIDGDTAVIGAMSDYLGPFLEGVQIGSAYVFRFNGSEWVQEQKLMPSDGEEDDGFGRAVAVSGNTIAIGSPGEDENGNGAGAVYLYDFDGNTWVEQQKLLGAGGKTLHPTTFGNALALDGDRLLVGAPWDDTDGLNHGAAYTYHRQGGLWTLEQLVVPNINGGIGLNLSMYGWSVALDGEVMVVGAHNIASGPPLRFGAAFVFRFDGSNWVHEQTLLPPIFVPNGVFGHSVAVSGDTALIGDYQANDWVGAAHVFVFNGAAWVQTAVLVQSDADEPDPLGAPPYFGMALSLEGSTAAIAAPHRDTPALGGDQGVVYMFDLDTPPGQCECPADLDGNGIVGAADLAMLLGAWGPNPGNPADFDGDDIVAAFDLAVLLGAWGPCE